MKLDGAGAYLWHERFAPPPGPLVGTGGALDVVLAGSFTGTLDLGGTLVSAGASDIYLARLDADVARVSF
ncbi:hypothetical protein [Sorangium sp. So ce1000]|uniref:hypothetical protein n=1 Tax=Sorangium sp. So ce1000 TaxID=3133325 RepID=UPI003F61108C